MKIKGPKKLVKRAKFVAELFDIRDFDLKMAWTKGDSYCRRNNNGTFTIKISRAMSKYWLIELVGHEMIHLKQYKDGRLKNGFGCVLWEGKRYEIADDSTSKEYFLSPWEIDARGHEDYVGWCWRNR